MVYLKEYELFEEVDTIYDRQWEMKRCIDLFSERVWRADLYYSDICIWQVVTADKDVKSGPNNTDKDVRDYYKELCPGTGVSRNEFVDLYDDYKRNKETLWYNHMFNLMIQNYNSYMLGEPSGRKVLYDSKKKDSPYSIDFSQSELYLVGYVLNFAKLNYFDGEWITIK